MALNKKRTLITVAICINFLVSLYNWSVYAYNVKDIGLRYSLANELYIGEEKLKKLAELNTLQMSWEESRKEWLLKLQIDLGVLLLVVFKYFPCCREETPDKINEDVKW